MKKKQQQRKVKQTRQMTEGFEPTKMALAVSSAAVTSLLLLGLMATM